MGETTRNLLRQDSIDYINATSWAELATVREDGTPVIRTIGAFALNEGGTSIYFATFPNADKTQHIARNNRVSFFFQHEGQQLHEFRNVELLGDTGKVTGEEDILHVATLLSARSPFVKEFIEKNGIAVFDYYEVEVTEGKFLDYRHGIGPQAIEVIRL